MLDSVDWNLVLTGTFALVGGAGLISFMWHLVKENQSILTKKVDEASLEVDAAEEEKAASLKEVAKDAHAETATFRKRVEDKLVAIEKKVEAFKDVLRDEMDRKDTLVAAAALQRHNEHLKNFGVLQQHVRDLQTELHQDYYSRRDLEPRITNIEESQREILVAILHRNTVDRRTLKRHMEELDDDEQGSTA